MPFLAVHLRLLGLTLLLGWALPSTAQPTNLETYQRLAVDCVAEVPEAVVALRLAVPPQYPYLRAALVERWQQEQRRVYLPDSAGAATYPTLELTVEEAQVQYARAGRGSVDRSVHLALRYLLAGTDGQVLREGRCRDTYDDLVSRDDLAALESPAYPETQGERPPAGWLRRYAQPAVLATATAVAVYLFFSLRSNRADDG